MDALTAAAAQALAAGDPIGALKRVALRRDPAALALRGIAMAQLGDWQRARELLRDAALGFGKPAATARARCLIAEAEIALVSRDLTWPGNRLNEARALLLSRGDLANAGHAGYLEARRHLLIGQLATAEQVMNSIDPVQLTPASLAGFWLVAAGIAMRQLAIPRASEALDAAASAATDARIPMLLAEVQRTRDFLQAPAARLFSSGRESVLHLAEVADVLRGPVLVVDACRNAVCADGKTVPLGRRPVLFALARALTEAWPNDRDRGVLISHAFRSQHADDSMRARLRVEIGRLRAALGALGGIKATARGYRLVPHGSAGVAVLTPPIIDDHAAVLALLAEGEAWSSSALALALGRSPRTVQRALRQLAAAGKAESFGRGRACRWIAPRMPGFPTTLLLPPPLPDG